MTTSNDDMPPVNLDQYRGMAAQKETDVRRHLSEVEADQAARQVGNAEFEKFLFAAPTVTWDEAAAKAEYLLKLFAATPEAQDPRIKQMIAGVIEDFHRLGGKPKL